MQSQVNVVVKVPDTPAAAAPSAPADGPSKKRRRGSDEDISDAIPDGIAAVFLSRDQLLTISSADHEAQVQRLINLRELTEVELKEVKRQRRLIKNREYAQTSRQKKKVTMGHVKDQVNSLEYENESLKDELAAMKARVAELELENASLRIRLSKDQTSSEDSSDAVVDMEVDPSSASYFSKLSSKAKPVIASTMLFVLLFSFGLLFNSPLFTSTSSLPGASKLPLMQPAGRALLTVPSASMGSLSEPLAADGISSFEASRVIDPMNDTRAPVDLSTSDFHTQICTDSSCQ